MGGYPGGHRFNRLCGGEKDMKLLILPLAGILAIVGLECLALAKGINGGLMALAFAGIGAIATGGGIKLYGTLKAKGFNLKIGKEQG